MTFHEAGKQVSATAFHCSLVTASMASICPDLKYLIGFMSTCCFLLVFRSLHLKPISCARVYFVIIVDSHTTVIHHPTSVVPRSILSLTMKGSLGRNKYGSMQSMFRYGLLFVVTVHAQALYAHLQFVPWFLFFDSVM